MASKWTEDVVARLKTLWADGYSLSRCAVILSSNKSTVQDRIRILGLKKRHTKIQVKRTDVWSNEDTEKLKMLWSAGHSGAYLASVFGITRNAIMGKVQRLGLAKRRTTVQVERVVKAPPIDIQVVPDSFLRLPFSQLKGCRYPRTFEGVHLFCGQVPVVKKSSYCAYCHSICYRGFGDRPR